MKAAILTFINSPFYKSFHLVLVITLQIHLLVFAYELINYFLYTWLLFLMHDHTYCVVYKNVLLRCLNIDTSSQCYLIHDCSIRLFVACNSRERYFVHCLALIDALTSSNRLWPSFLTSGNTNTHTCIHRINYLRTYILPLQLNKLATTTSSR